MALINLSAQHLSEPVCQRFMSVTKSWWSGNGSNLTILDEFGEMLKEILYREHTNLKVRLYLVRKSYNCVTSQFT